jgi:hypothetical protein
MTLKERKNLIEQNVKYALQQAVGENVNVGAAYSIDNGVLTASLTERHINEEAGVLEGVVNYGIRYDENINNLSIYAFSRRYQYDALGIVNSITEPVYVDEQFISNIKDLIRFGMSDEFDANAFNPQPVEEVQAEIVEE